jgi:hypothetical protein
MRVQTFGTWTGAISGIGAGALTASPDYQFLAPYLALASAAVWAVLLLWFLIANRREIQLGVSKLGSWYFIVPCLALAILAIAGAAYGLGLRSALSRSTPEKTKEVVATHIDLGSVGTENKSILVVNRYYSAKNKEEVAGRLDAIASEINSHGDEILKNAEVAINRSRWEAPDQDLDPEIDRMNKIIALFDEMKTALYDHLVDRERDYRVEVNAILFPQEQFIQFKNGAEQFRDGLSCGSGFATETPVRLS